MGNLLYKRFNDDAETDFIIEQLSIETSKLKMMMQTEDANSNEIREQIHKVRLLSREIQVNRNHEFEEMQDRVMENRRENLRNGIKTHF